MAELHVIDALREKRPELDGIVGHLERQVVHHRASLAHLDAATRLFDLAQYGSVSAVRCQRQWAKGVSKTWGATPRAGLVGGQSVRPAARL